MGSTVKEVANNPSHDAESTTVIMGIELFKRKFITLEGEVEEARETGTRLLRSILTVRIKFY